MDPTNAIICKNHDAHVMTNGTLEIHLRALRDSIDRLSTKIEQTHARIDADIHAKALRRHQTECWLLLILITVDAIYLTLQALHLI
jgi:hypothetical protein